MNGKEGEQEAQATGITPLPTANTPIAQVFTIEPKKKFSLRPLLKFIFNPTQKTVLGRSSPNWAKLSAFYTVFFFCLACFFTVLLYLFALTLDSREPKYYNEDSTMTVRTSASIVGLGFRPQPNVRENMILITDDPIQQENMVSSLRLFRDIHLKQKPDAEVRECTEDDQADELPRGFACAFDWSDIVNSASHPCSDANLFGFKNKQPCVLIKVNKVYDWMPHGIATVSTYGKQTISKHVNLASRDVRVTCEGAQPDDQAILQDLVYYSLENPSGSIDYGAIPYHYFPYRNARDHVQPFILVQFKSLPPNRIIDVICKISAPGLKPDRRTMRGYVAFQLHYSKTDDKNVEDL